MPKTLVLDLVQEFCTSVAFEEEFEGFAKEFAETFQDSLETKCSEGEHPLEYYDAYRAYISRFEGKISDFIEKVIFSLCFILIICCSLMVLCTVDR
jgi:hypothetical protein